MILATVGTQLPFPRLIHALDRLAGERDLRVVAQAIERAPVTHIEQHEFLDTATFDRLLSEARILVGHAGIGTIMSAAKARKPLVMFPRRFALREHRNDHQVATALAFQNHTGIHVAWNEADLERLVCEERLEPVAKSSSLRRGPLLAGVREFLAQAAMR